MLLLRFLVFCYQSMLDTHPSCPAYRERQRDEKEVGWILEEQKLELGGK